MSESEPRSGGATGLPSIWRAALLLIAMLALGWSGVYVLRNRPTPESRAMESLIAFTLERGKPTWVPPVALNYFGLPTEQVRFLQIEAVSESGRRRAIQVRRAKTTARWTCSS